MLSQAVIIFDEFEPMLRTRKPKVIFDENKRDMELLAETANKLLSTVIEMFKDTPHGNPEFQNQLMQIARSVASDAKEPYKSEDPSLRNIANELKEIRKKDDPKFRFLLAGMLPKFLKLHDAAKERSFVYFLGTNVLKDIDPAARRTGRFDLKIPIYHPCPLSRAGTFLYRLSNCVESAEKLDLFKDKIKLKHFLEVILTTANEPASELAQKYFNEKKENNFGYVLQKKGKYSPTLEKDKIEKMQKDFDENAENLDELEIEEYEWLVGFEKYFKEKMDGEFNNLQDHELNEFLAEILRYEPARRLNRNSVVTV